MVLSSISWCNPRISNLPKHRIRGLVNAEEEGIMAKRTENIVGEVRSGTGEIRNRLGHTPACVEQSNCETFSNCIEGDSDCGGLDT